jgi:hypothetical protein
VTRQVPGLRAPQPDQAAQVPITSRRRPLWRACARTHPQPWWYATRTDGPHPGRFDLADPDGTCYWAMTPATALLEVTADPQQLDPPVLSVAALQRLSVWRADTVPAARSKLADTTVASVPGLTAELATIVPYDLAWQWADALHAEGRSGIVYRSRFGQDDGVALFGPPGIPPHTPEATRQSALAYGGELPPAFLAQIGTVGALDQLERGEDPRPPGAP